MRDRNRLSTPAGALAMAAVVLSSLLSASCSGPEKAAGSPAAAASPEASASPKARDLTLDPAQRQKIRLETSSSSGRSSRCFVVIRSSSIERRPAARSLMA